MSSSKSLRELSCADDYDPNSMPVAKAREYIRAVLEPVSAFERLHIRDALGRVLAADVISPVDVPGHDNSAMDGYAVRHEDLKGAEAGSPVVLKVVGDIRAGAPPRKRPTLAESGFRGRRGVRGPAARAWRSGQGVSF